MFLLLLYVRDFVSRLLHADAQGKAGCAVREREEQMLAGLYETH